MRTKELLPESDFEEDTYRLLDISLDFLVQYFGHSESEAENLIVQFYLSFAEFYDEDTLHHESSYRVAAMIHYLVSLGGSRDSVGNWLLREGHNHPPRETFEYFREHYFTK